MLSRLKGKRTPSASENGSPSPRESLSDRDLNGTLNGNSSEVVATDFAPPSPTPSSRSRTKAATTNGRLAPDDPSARSLSPNRYVQTRGRSASTGAGGATLAMGAGDRRSMNLSMPVVGGAGVGLSASQQPGEGSLSFEHLELQDGAGGPVRVVQAPELITSLASPILGDGEDQALLTPVPNPEQRFDLTPTPSHPAMLGSAQRSSSSPAPSIHAPTPVGRPRSSTTTSQLSVHGPTSVSLSPSTSNQSLDSHSVAGTSSRPGSRSASVTSQDRDHLNLPGRPSTQRSTSASRTSTLEVLNPISKSLKKTRSNTGMSGIAGALALSGVALASPSQSLRQPLPLVRQPSSQNLTTQSTRDSMDTGGESDTHSQFSGIGDQGFVSMDALGDFDDVVSQLGTGYAVASSKRNADFHAIFKNIPDDDYLIEDYGCALQREILIQGRLYISEHHLSFNANIFGWVTTHTLPFAEIVSIEKRMTAYVIPNAIQVTTLHARYTFASFLSRDTTYDLVGNIWRMMHPGVPASAGLPDSAVNDTDDEDHADVGSLGSNEEEAAAAAVVAAVGGKKAAIKRLKGLRRRGQSDPSGNTGEKTATLSAGPRPSISGASRHASKQDLKVHPVTTDTCQTLKNLKEVCMDTVFPSAPEKIYNLMFTSGFMKEFWSNNQKLLELQISDWAPEKSGSNLLARSMSYIKPLNGSIGPKQTKCLITDESMHVDFDDYVCIITTTKTPDVPSGSAFAVKTRTSMTWAKGNSCRVVVTTGVEWSKSSFIKGIIERSCIDGQKTYHTDLEKAMRSYIQQHRSEFLEDGHDVDSASIADTASVTESTAAATNVTGTTESEEKEEKQSTLAAAIDFVSEMVNGVSPATAGLAFVIAVLVISNLWTLSSRPKTGVPTPRTALGRDGGGAAKNPDEIAMAVRGALQDYFKAPAVELEVEEEGEKIVIGGGGAAGLPGVTTRAEVEEIGKALDRLEERIKTLREGLKGLEEKEKVIVVSADGEAVELD
ncbi:gram domain protein [Pseudohyphozyma bogoriensis]|nr:gram domain protein [Pseudohyphozyma bogoriensis]